MQQSALCVSCEWVCYDTREDKRIILWLWPSQKVAINRYIMPQFSCPRQRVARRGVRFFLPLLRCTQERYRFDAGKVSKPKATHDCEFALNSAFYCYLLWLPINRLMELEGSIFDLAHDRVLCAAQLGPKVNFAGSEPFAFVTAVAKKLIFYFSLLLWFDEAK